MNDDAFGTVLSPSELRFERLLPGPIETVWAFLTESKMRGEWLGSGPMDLRVGGEVQFFIKHSDLSPNKAPPPERFAEMDKSGHQSKGTITAIDPPRLLAMTWHGTSEVTFELEARGDKVLLILTHRRLANREELWGTMGGWHAHLAILVDKAWGNTPPAFWDVWRRADSAYRERAQRG